HFRRQVPIGSYVADFCCLSPKLVVEIDGNHHGFERNADHDRRRTEYLTGQGFRVIRFTNREVMMEIDSVVDTIRAELEASSLPLAGRDRGWGSESQSAGFDGRSAEADTAPLPAPAHPAAPPPPLTPPRKGDRNVA